MAICRTKNMTTSPTIYLDTLETKLFEAQDPSFLPGWRDKTARLHDEFPGHCINTFGQDKTGKLHHLFIWSGELLNK